MSLTVTVEDEQWMRQGVIKELIETYGYMKDEAIQIFEKSSLVKMLHRDPEYAFGKCRWCRWSPEFIPFPGAE
jgi:hypothetical protein